MSIYGVSQTSLVTVFEMLRAIARKKKVKIAIAEKEWKEAPIIIFPTYKLFKRHMKVMEKKRIIPIILDSPLQLMEIQGLKFLDIENKPGLSYIFKLKTLDRAKLRMIVRKVKEEKVERLILETKNFDLIPNLLDTVREGRFLDKFLSLTSTTKLETRNRVRLATTNYLFGTYKLVKLEALLQDQFKRGLAQEYAVKVIDYLNSPEGKKLHTACQHIKVKRTGKNKQIAYHAIAKKFGVDASELKYLSKVHRSSLREDDFKPEIISRKMAESSKLKAQVLADSMGDM